MSALNHTFGLTGYGSDATTVVADRRVALVGTAGMAILRYGLVLLLAMWGAAKFTAGEADAIRPLVENSPLLGWLYRAFGIRGASSLFGVFEVAVAILIATRRWLPRLSGVASLASAGMFVITLSFLVTTPNVFAPSSPWGGFLMKDLILLGAALTIAGESFGATRRAE